VEFSHHEGGPGQQEIDLRYADALSTADNIMTFRTVIREVALSQGIWATFMPKPYTTHPGSGMHTHVSLFEGDRNAFFEAGAEYQLSKTGRQFIAGILRHANEISCVTNQWVNSYKRMMFGGEAPSYICWGHNNRSAMIRVPMYKPNKGQSTRMELRTIDSACNPYLAFAVVLAAGMKGIEESYDLPREAEDDVWSLNERERKSLGIDPLPKSLLPAQQARGVGGVPRPGVGLRARQDAAAHLRDVSRVDFAREHATVAGRRARGPVPTGLAG
jgi:glutamine synthetase